MADPKQALEDLALLVALSDRMAEEGNGSMYQADTLAQRNAVVRRLREFIEAHVSGVEARIEALGAEIDQKLENYDQPQEFEPELVALAEAAVARLAGNAGVTVAPAPLTDEECDKAAAQAMDRVAAKRNMHALDLNPDITAHNTLRRELIRAGYALAANGVRVLDGESEQRQTPMPEEPDRC